MAPTTVPIVLAPGEPWLAFQIFGSKSEIALARLDGSDLHRPTQDVPGGDQTNADWSPDGAQVVFGVTVDGRDDLWVVGTDGHGARVLIDCEAPCLWLDDPAWSPDGTAVLFSRNTEINGAVVGTLERLDLASGASEVIVTAAETNFYAGQRWSPDGKSVVLEVIERDGPGVDDDVVGVTLAVIDLADPKPGGRALTKPGTWPETAAWSPDGREIAFAAKPTPDAAGTDLFAIRPDGSGLRRLTDLTGKGGSATHPAFSPDGSWLAFAAQLPGQAGTVLAATDRQVARSGQRPAARSTSRAFTRGSGRCRDQLEPAAPPRRDQSRTRIVPSVLQRPGAPALSRRGGQWAASVAGARDRRPT